MHLLHAAHYRKCTVVVRDVILCAGVPWARAEASWRPSDGWSPDALRIKDMSRSALHKPAAAGGGRRPGCGAGEEERRVTSGDATGGARSEGSRPSAPCRLPCARGSSHIFLTEPCSHPIRSFHDCPPPLPGVYGQSTENSNSIRRTDFRNPF